MVHPQTHTSSGATLTLARVRPYEGLGIAVVSPALDAQGRFDDRYTAWHENESPAISWSWIIEAQSYALVVQGADADSDRPFVNWMVWNIPGDATSLPIKLSHDATPSELLGVIQGRNSDGGFGWCGPKPAEGAGLHHYHIQLFALSTPLDHLPPETSLEQLVTVLKGLTLASGEIVGTYERPSPIADARSPGRTGGYGSAPFADTAREIAAGRGGLDADDLDRHAPHAPDGTVQRR